MNKSVRYGIAWLSLAVLVLMLSSCKEAQLPMVPRVSEPDILRETPDPAISRTMQADVAMTAAWLLTLTPAASSPDRAVLTVEPPSSAGTPAVGRSGVCPVPQGFVLQDRQGFCLSAPTSWVVLNADGGIAGFLNSTPGQMIALQPDWAQSTAVCNLLIYISAADSPLSHLDVRHKQFSSQKDIQDISPIGAYALGEIGILGFTWSYKNGETGAVYADMVGPGRLLHISYDGSKCPLEDLLPVLETLRFNS